jgi:hypothetical protein
MDFYSRHFAAHVISGLCARQTMSLDDLKLDGPGIAYWIAAEMVTLRANLPIKVTPVPTPPSEGPSKPHPPHPAVSEV